MSNKIPTRSPTHEDVELGRLSSMGLELEEIAEPSPAGEAVKLRALIELAEDRGRPASHYLAAVALATELTVDCEPTPARLTVRVCAGTCQRWGALEMLDHLVARWEKSPPATFAIVPVTCLDRCDHAPASEIISPDGQLKLGPTTKAALTEALDELSRG